eukprot:3012846-Rhodomonas_salina.1
MANRAIMAKAEPKSTLDPQTPSQHRKQESQINPDSFRDSQQVQAGRGEDDNDKEEERRIRLGRGQLLQSYPPGSAPESGAGEGEIEEGVEGQGGTGGGAESDEEVAFRAEKGGRKGAVADKEGGRARGGSGRAGAAETDE